MNPQKVVVGRKNITFGWVWLLSGLICGAILSLWSFNGPLLSPLGDYTALPRRLVRLAHIAFIALAIVNILYGSSIDNTQLKKKWKNIGSQSLILGAIFMPVLLIIATSYEPIKYFLILPGTLVIIGVFVITIGLLRK